LPRDGRLVDLAGELAKETDDVDVVLVTQGGELEQRACRNIGVRDLGVDPARDVVAVVTAHFEADEEGESGEGLGHGLAWTRVSGVAQRDARVELNRKTGRSEGGRASVRCGS
jgi:hypothetical protein